MALRDNMIPGTLSTHALEEEPSSKRVQSMLLSVLLALLINGIAFGMVRRSEHLLDPEGAQQLAPYLAHKLSSSVREEPARHAEVGDHMPKKGLTHSVCGVVARWDKDGMPRVAVHKHDEELLAVVGGERSHNVYRQGVPWPLGLDGSRRLLTVAIITTHLTLGTALGDFEANAATSLVVVVVMEELPQRLPTEVGGRVELLREFPCFILFSRRRMWRSTSSGGAGSTGNQLRPST